MVTESPDRLLRLSEVLTITSLGRSSVYRMMRVGTFPEPLKIGVRAVRWRESEIETWIAARPRSLSEDSFLETKHATQ